MRRSVSFWLSLGSPSSAADAELATNQKKSSRVVRRPADRTAHGAGYVSFDSVVATSVTLEASVFPAGDTPDT